MRSTIPTLMLLLSTAATVHAGPDEARAFKAQGDGLVQRGKAAEAIAAYESAIKADPEWLTAYDALAASLFAEGRYDDVVKKLKPVVDKHADYANGLYSLGYAYRKTGKNAESVAVYNQYLKLRPDDPEAYYGLGRAQAALGKKEEAMAALDKYVGMEKRPSEKRWVEKAKADLAEWKKAGVKPAAAKEEAGSPGERTVTAKATALCDQADAAEKALKFQDAYDLYGKCRGVDASNTRAYDGLGESGLRLRKYKDMVAMFRGALADNPGYSAGFYYLGRALRETGKKPEALDAVKRFISLQPTNPEGLIELGMLYKETGAKDDAVKALKKYLEVENRPGRESTRKTAEDALKELGAGK
jgi:tetratricopeptide (TPR) repeat protein